jgi:hypothetical protein
LRADLALTDLALGDRLFRDRLPVDLPLVDHEVIVRQKGEMIGKLQRDQRSGVRDQKKNDLRTVRRGDFGGGGLDLWFVAFPTIIIGSEEARHEHGRKGARERSYAR